MAATIGSQASMTIQRARGGGRGWEAVAGKLVVANAMTLDTLVSLLGNRYGGVKAILDMNHTSKPDEYQEPKKPGAKPKVSTGKRVRASRSTTGAGPGRPSGPSTNREARVR
jgi:hypothetical protein